MSDSGILEAVLAEIVSTIKASDEAGVVTVESSQSVRELIQRDAQTLPAIGVSYRGFERVDNALGSKKFGAMTHWEIAICVRNENRQPAALLEMIGFLTTVRDRVHYTKCTKDPFTRYLVMAETVDDVEGSDLIAGLVRVDVKIALGNP